ncbi:MAG: peptidase domain-containing ABC transporter [Candidatus Stahlbacteria bacterium]|nr:peptidase domain-containing ABC transporter [Candidatus Stahlbacteria bacterium]
MKELTRFFYLIRPYWKFIVESIVVGVLITLLGIPFPYFTKLLIDDVFIGKDKSLLLFVVLGILFFTIFRQLISSLRSYFVLHTQQEMGLDIQFKFYHHLLKLPFKFYDSKEIGEVLSRFGDAGQSLMFTVNLINRLIMSSISLLIFPAILFYIHWKLALLALAVFPLNAYIFMQVSKIIRRYWKRIAEKSADASAKNYESLSGIRTIQSLTIEDKIFDKLRSLFSGVRDLQLRSGFVQQSSNFSLNTLQAIGTFLYMWYGWNLILNGSLSLGTYLAFTMFIGYVAGPIQEIVSLIGEIQPALVHINRFFEYYDIEPDIRDMPGSISAPKFIGSIQFEDVSFSYNSGPPVLSNINIEIPAGTTVAVVGKSGVGKSTFAYLIPRFYDPSSGRILIDGYDIKELKLKSLRQNIGFVFQEPFIFHGTMRDNIICSHSKASQSEVEKAAQIANIHEFIMKLPNGYDTNVGERGVKISYGQKQRLVLARILLLDPSILILDEPTSSVDMETEHEIMDALKQVTKGRTTIIIAHRLSTIVDADLILVIEDGRIVEKGNHNKLLLDGNSYSRLYSSTMLI